MGSGGLLALVILVLVLSWVIKGFILHQLTRILKFEGASGRKTVKVLVLLTLLGLIYSVLLRRASGTEASLLVTLLAIGIFFGLSVAILKHEYRARIGWCVLVVLALAVYEGSLSLGIERYLFDTFRIPSAGMIPSLEPNDLITVSRLDYRLAEPGRGDVVVFEYPLDRSVDYIKRIIGLPGETIEVRKGQVFIDGQPLHEDWELGTDLPAGGRIRPQSHNFGPQVIPTGEYFMLGDNRNNSADSRYWGTVPRDLIIGKVVLRYWPMARWGGV